MICPKCNKNIHKLNYEETCETSGYVDELIGSRELINDSVIKFTCPECCEEIEGIENMLQALRELHKKIDRSDKNENNTN